MSTHEKPDLARAWLAVEDRLFAREVARVEKLSDEELAAEAKAEGLDPSRLPTAAEIIARAEEREKLARGWRGVEKLIDQRDDEALAREIERVEKLSDEELDAEIKAEGLDPERLRGVDEIIARAKEAKQAESPSPAGTGGEPKVGSGGPGKVIPLTGTRPPRSRMPFLLAAAMFLVVLGFAAVNSAAIVRWLEGEPHQPTPQERAQVLRKEAQELCDEHQWETCQQKLDEAQKDDPAGEADRHVKNMRTLIAIGLGDEGGTAPKKK